MPANAWPTANIGGSSETINAQGELVLTGTYKGTPINQTVPTHPPCLVFINTVDRNVQVVKNIDEIPTGPEYELVKVIKTIT